MRRPTVELPVRFRQSTFEKAKCLYAYRRQFIDGIREPDTEAALRGTEFHRLAREYVRHLCALGYGTDYDKADELASDSEAGEMFLSWVGQRVFDPETIAATEYQITLDWDFKPCSRSLPAGDSPFSGDLDRLEIDGDEADIWDYKTTLAVFDADTIQAVYYPWLLTKVMPGLKKVRFHLDFTRYNTVREREFTREEIDLKEKRIIGYCEEIIEVLESGEFPARVNARCAWCLHECPLVKAGMERGRIGQIGSMVEAEKMAAQVIALETQAARMKKTLKAYANYVGDVIPAGTDHHFRYSKVESWDWDTPMVSTLNTEHGFEPLRGLSGDTRELKKIFRDYPDYESKLKGKSKNKTRTEFRAVKNVREDGDDDTEVQDD